MLFSLLKGVWKGQWGPEFGGWEADRELFDLRVTPHSQLWTCSFLHHAVQSGMGNLQSRWVWTKPVNIGKLWNKKTQITIQYSSPLIGIPKRI